MSDDRMKDDMEAIQVNPDMGTQDQTHSKALTDLREANGRNWLLMYDHKEGLGVVIASSCEPMFLVDAYRTLIYAIQCAGLKVAEWAEEEEA
jgi:hypothetical protein